MDKADENPPRGDFGSKQGFGGVKRERFIIEWKSDLAVMSKTQSPLAAPACSRGAAPPET